jgi:hypothetical protein
MIAVLLICMLWLQAVPAEQNHVDKLPASARTTLNKRFPGWKFAEVNQEIQEFVQT